MKQGQSTRNALARNTAIAIVVVAGAAAGPAFTGTVPEAQYPALIDGFEIEAGYIQRDADDSDSFYKITHKGSLVTEEGTPFKAASHLDLGSPVSKVAKGDRNKLSIRLEDGTTTVGGALFELDGVKPLSFAGLNPQHVRGNSYVSADDNSLRYAVGLESRPFRIPGLAESSWSNWAVFGVNAQRTESDETTEDKSHGLLTYRFFTGRAFGWRKSADVEATASKLTGDLLALAPTHTDAAAIAEKIEAIDGSKRSELQQLFLDAYTEHEADGGEGWRQLLAELASGHADAVTDQPTLAFYAENTGFYDLDADEDELKNLFSANLDYWFIPSRDDVFIRLRYEYGYERAQPKDRKDQWMLLLSLKF